MAAQPASELPDGPDWVYEVKFDGYRALLVKDGTRVTLRSRNDKDLAATHPSVVAAGLTLPAARVMLDGEIVALDASGRPSFQALQHRSAHPGHAVVYYAFDLLYLEGEELLAQPLEARRRRLDPLVRGSAVRLSEALNGTAAQVMEAVRGLGLEGVVAKRKDSRYVPGDRSPSWRKLRLDSQQEFVVGGYRPGSHGIDALLVGYYEGPRLRFAGKVRAGFTPHIRRQLFGKLQPLALEGCPFVDLPNSRTSHWGGGVTPEQMREMRWVKPRLVAQIRFVEWTADGHLRHAAYLGLRQDKRPRDVRRESQA